MKFPLEFKHKNADYKFHSVIIVYIFSIFILFTILSFSHVSEFQTKIQYCEFYIDILNIIFALFIYSRTKLYSKAIVFLPISMLFLLFMDITYYYVFFVQKKEGSSSFLINTLVNTLWYAATISLLLSWLLKHIYGKTERIILIASFALSASIIILFFAPNFIKYLSYPYFSIDLTSNFTIFYLCILIIIATKDKSILLFISSLCIAEIGNIEMIECYLLNLPDLTVYGEFLWCVGLIGIGIGFLNLIRCNAFQPKDWFLNSNSIRNKLSFTIFNVSFFGFALACIAMKALGGLNKSSDTYIPAIASSYSLASAIISVAAGKYIERPFIKFKKYINDIFSNNNMYRDSDTRYVEFKELQDFLIESYEFKHNINEEIISLAKRIAHDIKSPAIVMENIIKSWDIQSSEAIKTQISKQIDKISYISRKMLKDSEDFKDITYGVQCIYNIITDLISDKRIEWGSGSEVTIDFHYYPNKILWISEKQAEIRHVLSNLLNNSFEASTGTNQNVRLSVNTENNNIIINIDDSGHGIPHDEINNILQGKSLKPGGHGIGLSSAKKFIDSINGTMSIKSIVNNGTNIELTIPLLTFNSQFSDTIRIKTKQIVILDDDPYIINKWQKFFLESSVDLKINYFVSTAKLINYLKSNNSGDATYLFDYRLFKEKVTGVDIANQFQLKDVYLITNYADDGKLQAEISNLPIKLIPKIMLDENIVFIN